MTTAVDLIDGGDDEDDPPEIEVQECVPTTGNISVGDVEGDDNDTHGPDNNAAAVVAANPPAPLAHNVANVRRSTRNRISRAMYRKDFSNKKCKNDDHVTGTIHINVEDTPQGDL